MSSLSLSLIHTHTHTHTQGKKTKKMVTICGDTYVNYLIVINSYCISKHQVVHVKYIQFLFSIIPQQSCGGSGGVEKDVPVLPGSTHCSYQVSKALMLWRDSRESQCLKYIRLIHGNGLWMKTFALTLQLECSTIYSRKTEMSILLLSCIFFAL